LGRIFALWTVVYFGQSFENYTSRANIWMYFFPSVYRLILTKMGWAILLTNMPQTHLVTLLLSLTSCHPAPALMDKASAKQACTGCVQKTRKKLYFQLPL
jgi:hypothetical protein